VTPAMEREIERPLRKNKYCEVGEMAAEQDALYALLVAQDVEHCLALRLAEYGQFVLRANRKFNLTGARTPADIVGHILDSLSITPYVVGPHVDVGSGAGLPAIPVALATGVEVVLIESSAKKAAFLCEALERLGVRGQVVADRAERAAHNGAWRERFATATARGVSSAPAVAELTLPFLRIGGQAVLQRGTAEAREVTALTGAALMLGGRSTRTVELAPSRALILIGKETATPARFPRRPGIPHKRPLCAES